MAGGQDGVEVVSMMDLFLVKKDILVLGAMRGVERGLLNHHVVLCKVRSAGT